MSHLCVCDSFVGDTINEFVGCEGGEARPAVIED
jgi:hypothetical protein